MHGVPSRTHTEQWFNVLNILKAGNLHKYNFALFMYGLNISKLPDIFRCLYMIMKSIAKELYS